MPENSTYQIAQSSNDAWKKQWVEQQRREINRELAPLQKHLPVEPKPAPVSPAPPPAASSDLTLPAYQPNSDPAIENVLAINAECVRLFSAIPHDAAGEVERVPLKAAQNCKSRAEAAFDKLTPAEQVVAKAYVAQYNRQVHEKEFVAEQAQREIVEQKAKHDAMIRDNLSAAGGWIVTVLVVVLVLYVINRAIRKGQAQEQAWQDHKDTVHGTSRWQSFDELSRAGLVGQDQGLLVGMYYQETGKKKKKTTVPCPIRFNDDGHVLTFAPTGAGKGVSSVIPNLLTYPGSIVCIDPKGENAGKTARRRIEMGNLVLVVDPFGRTGMPSVCLNPLAWFDPDGPRASDDAAMLAECLVPDDGSSNPFWNNEARSLLAGLILYTAVEETPDRRHLGTVRDLLNSNPANWQKLLEHMSTSPHRLVQAAGNRALQKKEKEASSVLSVAQSCTHFLESELIRGALQGGPWDMGRLKKEKITLFLVLPAEELHTHARWLRLMISWILSALSREPVKPQDDVLFLLDEFAALGHLSAIETAMGLMRGYGVKLWPILQDLPQLQATYKKWQSFVANAGVVQFFGVNDQATAEYASGLLGKTTVRTGSVSDGQHGSSESISRTGRPLMMPDEIMRLPAHGELLKLRGKYPIYCGRLFYYRDQMFAGMWSEWP